VKKDDKQWWKVSYDEVKAPGAFRPSVVGNPDFYLNNIDMSVRKPSAGNNQVYVRKWDACSLRDKYQGADTMTLT
jgi:hypothetical protein